MKSAHPAPGTPHPEYVVGIDLGTTNSAAAYVALADPGRAVVQLPVPQLIGEATIRERPTLPSFLYLGGEHDVAPGALALPWDAHRSYAVGEFARLQGARVPGRLVSSAKSWLCHGGVDREAAILPWGGPADVAKLSPVEASARYLVHLREAWAQRFPDTPLEAQDIILTVPASFDEVARELTVEAAARAGLGRVVLLEEPQAAFYAWLHRNEATWEQQVAGIGLIAVIDIGGGTTDFSLIKVAPVDGRLALERLAVGDHLLLGGDNIDVALAHLLEPRLGVKLDSQRWYALTSSCRAAKETLLAADAPAETTIRLVGRGRAVVGGVLSATLRRDEVADLILNGFFPLTAADAGTDTWASHWTMPPEGTEPSAQAGGGPSSPSTDGTPALIAARPRLASISVTFTGSPGVTTPSSARASSRSPCASTRARSNLWIVCESRKSIS